MPRILETDAFALARGIDAMDEAQRPQALDILSRYKQQQDNNGEPEWPSQAQARKDADNRLRGFFDDLKTVDAAAPSLAAVLPYSENPDVDRARVANTAYLASRYGKTADEIGASYELWRDDYATRFLQAPKGLDDLAFHASAAKEIQRVKQKEDTETEGIKAALRGDDVIPALQAWQAKNLDRIPDSTEFTRGFLKTRERAGEHLEFASSLLKQIESNTGLTKGEGGQRPTSASRETAAQFEESLATLATMKPKDRKQVYAIIGAKAEAAGYDPKGFWSQMLSELGKGMARMGSTVTTQAGVAGDVLENLPGMLSNTMRTEEFAATDASIARRQGIGEMYDEVAGIVAGGVDPVRPVVSWLNDSVEKGLIKGPGAVAPFMLASAALGPYGAGALFTADFAEQNRRELRAGGMDNDQAVAVGAAAAPLQAAVESLSNALQLGRFPAVQRVLSSFTKPIGGGAGLVTRYLQNSATSFATEFTEEQLQDNFIVPATQELLGALESDVPQVDWSMYRTRAIEQSPELLSILAPMALVFGGTMTSAQAQLSGAAMSSQEMLEAAGYSAAQANEIRIQTTEESKIIKAREFWGARAGTPQTIEAAAKTVGERMRMLQGDAVAAQKDLEQRGVLPRMLRAEENRWKLTFNDGSTADFNSHSEADAARWQWATDQLGKVHLATRSALAQLESGAAVGREFAVEFKPDALTAEQAMSEGRVDMAQLERRVAQGEAVGETAAEPVNEADAFDAATLTDKATSDYLSSLQILGSSVNQFKDGVLRTTIRLYEGANVLTLVEEKLEGDAKQIVESRPGREWLLKSLREYERVSGDKLFRDVADDSQLQNDDLIEAWSSLGQSYLVGKSKKGAAIGKGGARRIFADVLKAGMAGAMNSETQFFNAVWRRAAKLSKLNREGKLGADLTEELERQLGIDSQTRIESEIAAEAEAIANEALNVGGASYSEENPGPNGETFSLRSVTPAQDAEYLAAVEAGDTAAAQRMVDEVARAAGYNVGPVYHGTRSAFNKFNEPPYFTASELIASAYSTGKRPSQNKKQHQGAPRVIKAWLKLNNPLRFKNKSPDEAFLGGIPNFNNPISFFELLGKTADELKAAENKTRDAEGRQHGASYGLERFGAGSPLGWPTVIEALTGGVRSRISSSEGMSESVIRYLKTLGFDGVIFTDRAPGMFAEMNGHVSDTFVAFDPATQIKSADPVTRDADGNVIPLSQRFNPADDRITFSLRRKFDFASKLAPAAEMLRNMRQSGKAFDFATAYRAASAGQSSSMLPLSSLYDEAKKQVPALTEADFGKQIQALYDSGVLLLEPGESPQAVSDALGRFGVRDSLGIPAMFARPMDTGETFSLRVTPAQDTEYLAAVEAGDMETAQRMVDEAAKAAGFNTGPVYHSTNADFNEFSRDFLGSGGPQRIGFWFSSAKHQHRGGRFVSVYLNLANPLEVSRSDPNYPRISDGKAGDKFLAMLRERGFDGITTGSNYAVINPNQIKSADPVTYDEAGNVIPLSQRFNSADDRITYSIRSGDFSSRMSAAFSPFQRSPELRLALGRVAHQRALKLGADLIEKSGVIRSAGDISKEQKMREALGHDERLNAYLESLSPSARQELEFEPSSLENHPLIAAMLDHGKLMSRTTAVKNGVQNMDEFEGAPWIPPAWYSKGAGITPGKMAKALHEGVNGEGGPLVAGDSAADLWNAVSNIIESTRKNKALHREAVQAYKEASKAARIDAKLEAEAWANQATKAAGSPKAQREALKAALRTLDGILAAAPPEVRARVGGYVKLAGLATDEAMLKEIERRIEKLNVELEKWLKREGIEAIEKLFKKARPDSKAGKKDKGKDADTHALFAAAERASKMDEVAVAGELARLDTLIAGDTLTPEQEALAITERGLVELVGDLKHADAGRVYSALDTLRDIYQGGWIKWKLRQIEKREERAGMRAAFIADTGKSGIKPERDAADKAAVTLLGKIKGGFLSLSSFQEVLSYAFGSKSDRVKALVDAEREASGEYEDVTQALADEVESLFSNLAGGSVLAGERLRFDMAQRTIKTGKGELSQLEAIQALLMWRQEDGRRHMEGAMDENGKPIGTWNYDQAWIDEITAAMTPEARSVMSWLSQKYAAEHPALNALYRERYGVNMPAHDNYAPITVQPVQTKSGEVNDPVSGAAISSGSILVPGSLRARSRSAIAEPDFRDSLQTFMAHTRQLEYWKAYYDIAFESSAILGNREVLNSVKAKGGEPAATALRKWIDAIAQGGFRDASASLGLHKLLSRMTGRAASVGLLGRFSTLLVQSTQLGAASVKMPVGAYLVRLSKLLTGNLSFRDAINSPFIQRRYKSAPPIVRQALEGLGVASRPNQITRATRHLGNLLSGADAMFTAGTYAMLLDYHRGTGRALGLTGAELETHAHTEAERDTEAVAQPTRMATRSLAELTSTNPLAKVSWAYASEARQKFALAAWAATNAKTEPAQFAKVAFLVFGVGGLMTTVLKNLWREAKGDDDEEKWSPQRLTISAIMGPLHGVPLASELMGDQGMLSGAVWAWPALKDIAAGEGDMRDVDTLLSTLGLFNDTAAGVSSLSHAGLDAAKVIENLLE